MRLSYGLEQIHYRCRPFAVITGHIGRSSVHCRRRVRSSCAPELTPKEVDPGACAYGSSCRPTIGVLTALSCHSVERPLVEALPTGTATLRSALRMF